MPTAATEKSVGTTVSETDLAKSIELLEKALSGTSKIEKAVIGTDGGLQGKTPSDGDINKDIVPDEEEDEGDPDDEAAREASGIPIADGSVSGSGGSATPPAKGAGSTIQSATLKNGSALQLSDGSVSGGGRTAKSLTADEIPATDEEFAKSLSAAFTDAAPLVDASKGSNFAKSLVMSTIEGLSVACDEINKSLAESEDRTSTIIHAQSARIATLEKALTTVLGGVSEILENVRTVAKSPIRPTTKSVQVLEKSVTTERSNLSKAQVSDALLGMARANHPKVDAFTISRFESTGVIDPVLLAEVTTKGTGR